MTRARKPGEGPADSTTGKSGRFAIRPTRAHPVTKYLRSCIALGILLFQFTSGIHAHNRSHDRAGRHTGTLVPLTQVAPGHGLTGEDAAEKSAFPRLAGLNEKLPQLFLDAVNQLIQGEIRPKRIWYEAPATLQLRDVEVLEPGGERMASIEAATLDVSVTQLLVGRIRIQRLQLERPQVFLKMVNGELNVIRTFTPKKAPEEQEVDEDSNLMISIHDISVSGGHFSYRDPDVVDLAIDNIAGQADIDIATGTASVDISLTDVRADSGLVRLTELDIPLADLYVRAGNLENLVLSLQGIEGKALDAIIQGQGTIGVSKNGLFRLRCSVRAPENIWPGRLPSLDFELPSFDASVELSGPLQEPTVKAAGHFDAFSPYHTRVNSGAFDVTITTTDVQIASATAQLPAGSIASQGIYHINDRTIYLRASLDDVPLTQLLAPAELDADSRGLISGDLLLNGDFQENSEVTIEGDFAGEALSLYGVRAPTPARIRGDVEWTPAQTRLKNIRLTGNGYRAEFNGTADTQKKELSLVVNGESAHPERWYPDLPTEISIEKTEFEGQVAGPFDDVHVDLALGLSKAELWKVPVEQATTSLWVDAQRLEARDLKARIADGIADGTFALSLDAANSLAGQVKVTRAQLSRCDFGGDEPLSIEGQLNAEATLAGSLDAPEIDVLLQGRQLAYGNEGLGGLRGRLRVLGDALFVSNLDWQMDGISLQNESTLTLQYATLGMAGDLRFSVVDDKLLERRWNLPAHGRAGGTIRLGGSISRPALRAVGTLDQVKVEGETLGSGPFYVRVTEEAPSSTQATPLWLQISSELRSPQGRFHLRSTYAVSDQTIHAVLDVGDVPIERWTTRIPNLRPLEGELYAQLTATGPLDALDARLNLRVAKARLPLGDTRTTENESNSALFLRNTMGPPAYRPLGDLRLAATLDAGKLQGYVCALSWNSDITSSPCENVGLDLRFSGTLDQKKKAYDIELTSKLRESRVQDWVGLLQKEQAEASLQLSASARVWGDDFDNAPHVEGRLRLLEAAFSHPDMLPTSLARSTDITFREHEFALENPLRIEVGTPEDKIGGLEITGRATADEVDVLVEGDIELALLQFFTREITHASGRIDAHMWFQGSLQAPRVAGVLNPANGASISLRSVQERFEFNGGSVEFEPLNEMGTAHQIRASQLQIAMGGGNTQLNGNIELDAAELFSNGRFVPVRYALQASGSSVTLGHRSIWGESSFQLRFESNRRTPPGAQLTMQASATPASVDDETEDTSGFRGKLSGRIELSDGLLRERFEMTNFVLEARPDTPSEPLSNQILRFTELEEIELDVDLAVQSFQVRADLVSFLTTTQLSGELRLENTLTIPNLVGAIEVVDGSVRFPKTLLEFTEARVEFPRERVGLNPRIFVSARGELAAQPPVCTAEIPILLTLEGEDLNQVQMNLEAEESDLRHTRTELLSAVLLGQQLPRCSDGAGSVDPDVALRAVVSGLTSTLRKGIERFVADKTGSDFQLDLVVRDGRVGTDLRWKLSKRLQLEGGTGFGFGDDGTNAAGTLGSSAFARFLILDHFPVSGDLFVEGGFSSTDAAVINDNTAVELKLTYRVFGY